MAIPRLLLLGILAGLLEYGLAGCAFTPPTNTVAPEAIRSHKIVRTAYAQLGKRYRSGGATPQKGFDCSGLVWWSYGQNGIKLPRITTDQAKAGRKVHLKLAKPGDILVFRTGRSPRGLHTGIYAGEQKFIHSPGTGKVVCMESLSLPYWSDRLVAVRRIGK